LGALRRKYNRWVMNRTQAKLERKQKQLADLKAKRKANMITPAKFAARKNDLDHKIRFLDARSRKFRNWYKD